IVIATPVATILPLIKKLLPRLKRGAIVTDAGSVKADIIDGARALRWPRGVYFAGSHPLAGSHLTGVEAASPRLFEGSMCVVVPAHRQATRIVERLWRDAGARTKRLPARAHDAAVAVTSHLPHLIAHALVRTLSRNRDTATLRALAAGSFRDATRVASSDPEL